MSFRNISAQHMFEKLALEHKPAYRFGGKTKADFNKWKDAAYPKVIATLGDFPKRVPLNPLFMAEWEHDGLIKQRWLIDVGRHISVPFQVNIPKGMKKGEKRATILCWHGHGAFGKDAVMGNDGSPEIKADIVRFNYNYGHQMAKAGFVTFAIDWMGMGERNEAGKPNFHNQAASGRDWCNLFYLHATMLGMTPLSINVTHGMAATDFACSLPQVDPKRLGVMGLSGGGTMTLWSGLCDPRFKAIEIIGYSDLWAYFGIRDTNYCGSQVAPGLFKLVDLPDAQGLLAPKPLLVDIGAYDMCFRVDTAMACYRQVEAIYAAAGASARLGLDLYPNDHSWGGNKSAAFFKKYLA